MRGPRLSVISRILREILQNETVIVANETFGTVVGVAGVNGNQSIMPVDFGGVTIPDLSTRMFNSLLPEHVQILTNPFSPSLLCG